LFLSWGVNFYTTEETTKKISMNNNNGLDKQFPLYQLFQRTLKHNHNDKAQQLVASQSANKIPKTKS
jgi:hypothetical protein